MENMSSKFRKYHLTTILELFIKQNLPLDLFLKNYFKENKSIGSHDRKFLTENIYKMIRWRGLVRYLCKDDLSIENQIEILETLNPEEYLSNKTIPLHARLSFPQAYFDFLLEELGEEKTKEFCLQSNYPAPTTIRTNVLKTTRENLNDRLSKSQEVILGAHSPLAIHFAHRVNFLTLPEFKEGLFEVQDEASQLVSLEVKVKPGDHFLDYCAGSGGKSLAIAPQMKGKGQLYLHDTRTYPLGEAKKRLKRAGIQNAKVIDPLELKKQNLHGKMDWVLADVPCSGSGTLRRNPDMKWKFDLKALENTQLLQREIFAKALTFVKQNGYIVYSTCSVFPAENEKQTEFFLKNFPVKRASPSFFSFPSKGGMDGFYSVVLQKC